MSNDQQNPMEAMADKACRQCTRIMNRCCTNGVCHWWCVDCRIRVDVEQKPMSVETAMTPQDHDKAVDDACKNMFRAYGTKPIAPYLDTLISAVEARCNARVAALLDEIERLQFHSGLLKDALDTSTGNHRCLIPKGPA